MDQYEEKLKGYMSDKSISAEHLSFEQSCHSVEEASQAAGIGTDDIVKNICMIADGNIITAIVKGEDRASTSRVGKALGIDRPRIANPDEILEKTGYPCGGTPSFGYEAVFLIDQRVMEKDIVYTGGGSTSSLVRISTKELKNANNGRIVRARK